MINLLPPREKEIILMEIKKRMIIILCFLLLFFLVCLILISLSLKIYIQSQLEPQKVFLAENEKSFLQSESQELQNKIKSANSRIKELNSFYSQKIYFSEITERISGILPESFYLTNFSLVLYENREIMVSLSGSAPLREELLAFKENLELQNDFKNISFPPANWIKARNIDFNVTFKISP